MSQFSFNTKAGDKKPFSFASPLTKPAPAAGAGAAATPAPIPSFAAPATPAPAPAAVPVTPAATAPKTTSPTPSPTQTALMTSISASAASSNANLQKPTIQTLEKGFCPTEVQLKSASGQTKKYMLQHIQAASQFKPYSLIELRAFDYIVANQIDGIPAPPQSVTAAPTTSITAGLFSGVSSTTTPGADGKSQTVAGGFGQQQPQYQIKKDNVTMPAAIPFQVPTSSKYFKPDFKVAKQHTIQVDDSYTPKSKTRVEDYSILFAPRAKTLLDDKVKVRMAPLVISAQSLRPGIPESLPSGLAREVSDSSINFKTTPKLTHIANAKSVPGFRIEREGMAIVQFHDPVDLSAVDFEKDIYINYRFLDIYRNKLIMPPSGSGLNTKASVIMLNVFPIDEKGREDNSPLAKRDYQTQLADYLISRNAIFEMWTEEGKLHFLANDFTRGPFDLPPYVKEI